MDTNRKVFRNSSSTLGAELRGVFSRHFNYFTPGLFRLEAKYIKEPKPSYISHRPCEVMVVTIPGVHLLNTDSIVIGNEPIGSLELEVSALISYLLVGFGYEDSSLPPSVRTFDPTREPLLSHSQDILRLFKEAGISNLLTIRCSEEGLAADIDADRFAGFRERPPGDILTGESGIPFACRASADGHCLYIALNGAGQPELEPANIANSKIFVFKFPAYLFKGETVIPISALEAGEASFPIAVLNTAKEAFVGFIQPFKNILEYLRAYLFIFWEGILHLRELFHLIESRDRAFVLLVDGDALLKRRVVEMPTKSEPILGSLKGLRVSLKAILESLFHLSYTILRIPQSRKGVKPCRASPSVSPAINCGVLDGVFL